MSERMYYITADEFTAAMEAAVEERGFGFSYTMGEPAVPVDDGVACLYVHRVGDEKKPGCLIATALHKCGVPLQRMTAFEGRPAYAILTALTNLPGSVISAAGTAQGCQDRGDSWGVALHGYTEALR